MLVGDLGQRKQSAPRAAGQYDALHKQISSYNTCHDPLQLEPDARRADESDGYEACIHTAR